MQAFLLCAPSPRLDFIAPRWVAEDCSTGKPPFDLMSVH